MESLDLREEGRAGALFAISLATMQGSVLIKRDTPRDDDYHNISRRNFNNNNNDQRNGRSNGKGKRNARHQGNGRPSKKSQIFRKQITWANSKLLQQTKQGSGFG